MSKTFVFHVRLQEIAPAIWRRIEIRRDKTFWDLHCAIQDAMPWQDMHLHEFNFPSGDQETRIGIPDPDFDDLDVQESWDTKLKDWFFGASSRCIYLYDFGDGWSHSVTLEAIREAEKGGRYPRCLAGERACPPEDVGGVPGYERFLAAMADPGHPEHEDFRRWIGRSWEPEAFEPEKVRFSRPSARLRYAGLG